MEEHIGKRVNHERVDEALATDASKIATWLPVLPRDDHRRCRRPRPRSRCRGPSTSHNCCWQPDRNTITLPEKGAAARPRQPPRLRLKQHRWPSSQPPRPLHRPHQRKLPRPLRKLSRSRAWASWGGAKRPAPRRQPPRLRRGPKPADSAAPAAPVKGLVSRQAPNDPAPRRPHQRRLPPMPPRQQPGRRSTLCSRRTERAGEGDSVSPQVRDAPERRKPLGCTHCTGRSCALRDGCGACPTPAPDVWRWPRRPSPLNP